MTELDLDAMGRNCRLSCLGDCLALIAELEACRTELAKYRHDSYRCAHLTRAERAEADRDTARRLESSYLARADRAEARVRELATAIARVEALCDRNEALYSYFVADIRDALRVNDAS